MKSIFVTGIGTEVGKTYIIRQLLRRYNQKEALWSAIKPIVTGLEEVDITLSDTGLLLKAQDLALTQENVDKVSPWRYQAPVSPHLAAEWENQEIIFDKLIEFCRKSKKECPGGLLIEGVGGVMVPINRQYTVLDWIEALHIPCLVVAGTYLGAINHTLLTVAALRTRNIAVNAIVVNESLHSPVSLEDTLDAVRQFLPHIACYPLTRQFQAAPISDEFAFMSMA